ncbi:hypothetical protein T492DRAFT_1148929, partial [Pavlovales sp. CCMP2436]
MEVRLETEAVPFGPVVRNATATRRVQLENQLENQGDIGTRFEWDPLQLAPHFAISPLSGFIGPGEDVTFELTFSDALPYFHTKINIFIHNELGEDVNFELTFRMMICSIKMNLFIINGPGEDVTFELTFSMMRCPPLLFKKLYVGQRRHSHTQVR